MTGFMGADTEKLRAFSSTLAKHRQDLADRMSRIAPLVMDQSAWQGADADDFRARWMQNVGPAVSQLSNGIQGREFMLRQQAKAQDNVSDPNYKSPGEWAYDLTRLGVKGWSVYKGVTSLIGHIDDLKRWKSLADISAEAAETAWKSLQQRKYMEWASGGFGKLFESTIGKLLPGSISDVIPGDVWKKLGNVIDDLPTKLGEGDGLLSKIAAKMGDDWLSGLGKASSFLGKAVPVFDIINGAIQIGSADDGYGKTSGVLSVASGALVGVGMVFPPLAAVGGAVGVVSLGMDVVDLVGETFFDVDPSAWVSEKSAQAAEWVGEKTAEAGDWLQDKFSDFTSGLGSLFG